MSAIRFSSLKFCYISNTAGNDFAISELDSEDLDGLPGGKGRCFEPEPTDLPMGNWKTQTYSQYSLSILYYLGLT